MMCCLRAVNWFQNVYTACVNIFNESTSGPVQAGLACDRSFFLGEYCGDGLESHVPEDTIFVQEFRRGNTIRRAITYGDTKIVPYDGDPFKSVHVPWVWSGDDSTDNDLTSTLSKYLVPGNLITLELIFNFLYVKDDTNIVYIDSRTFIEHPFPADGIRIYAN